MIPEFKKFLFIKKKTHFISRAIPEINTESDLWHILQTLTLEFFSLIIS